MGLLKEEEEEEEEEDVVAACPAAPHMMLMPMGPLAAPTPRCGDATITDLRGPVNDHFHFQLVLQPDEGRLDFLLSRSLSLAPCLGLQRSYHDDIPTPTTCRRRARAAHRLLQGRLLPLHLQGVP